MAMAPAASMLLTSSHRPAAWVAGKLAFKLGIATSRNVSATGMSSISVLPLCSRVTRASAALGAAPDSCNACLV